LRMLNLDHRKLKKPLVAYDSLGEKEIGKQSSSFQPGEWICADDGKAQKVLVGYINPFAKKNELFRVVGLACKSIVDKDESSIAMGIIKSKIDKAIKKREVFKYIDEGCRLIFGSSDELPGLVVDKVNNYLLVQINTMGMFRYKECIEKCLREKFTENKICYLQNKNISTGEDLPEQAYEMDEEWIESVELGHRFAISRENLQKTGFYFDHRDNRKRLQNLISSYRKPLESGVDLFSYLGAWGMMLLKSGVESCQFVDQANLEDEFKKNLEMNGYSTRGQFIKSDVFTFLDVCSKNKTQFDVIVSDPPAFVKKAQDKKKAIVGYEKLHGKALACVKDQGVFVAASCTQPVSIEEFDQTVSKAATKLNKKVELLDIGIQSKDHPTESLISKSNYIKYLAYKVIYKSEIK
jgi:23S rRNA (cytosine1962-C5)-methyltransferase